MKICGNLGLAMPDLKDLAEGISTVRVFLKLQSCRVPTYPSSQLGE